MAEFPHMLCRPGTAIKWSGRWIDTLIVEGENEEAVARGAGWVSPHELLEGVSKPKRTQRKDRLNGAQAR